MHNILIPIDPSDYTKTAYKYLLKIATHNKVAVEGIAIIDNLNLAEAVSTYLPLPLGYEERLQKEEELLKDAKKKAREELKEFKKLCEENNLKCKSKKIVGRPDFVIEEASKYTDLVIMGMRNFFHFETSDTPEKTASKIIHYSQAPALLVTKEFKPINKVLIAFDGSNPAVKAAREFAKIAWNKEYEITIVVSHSSRSKGDELLQILENYLNEHTNARIEKHYTNQNIISAYDEKYAGKVDLVVCGMHSQNILQRLFVGSFPEHLINANNVPVLVAQ